MSRHRKAPGSPQIEPGWPGFNQRCLGKLDHTYDFGCDSPYDGQSRYEGLAYS